MGLSLSAPAPTLSPDKILKFDALAAAKQDVFDPPLPFPPITAEAGAWVPADPQRAVQQYADVNAAWLDPAVGTGAAATATALFVRAFGWIGDDGKALALYGEPPRVLIGGLDQFDLAPPVISVS
jgi:hypothetical protein